MTNIPTIGSLRHYPELDGRTFLLGIGGMKCATSWVFQYLEQLPGMMASDIKELHFFNAKLRPPGHAPLTSALVQSIRDYLDQAGNVAEEIRVNPQFQAAVDALRMLHDDNAYFDYFARLCLPDTKVLSEITPQYAVLGRDGYTYVKDFFSAQKMTLKVFLILRDPVERMWSHLRHLQDRGHAKDVLTDWRTLLPQRAVIERADYWQTVEALDAVFPADDLLYLFYEDLFQGDALQRLCAFTGLNYQPPNTTDRQNETGVKIALPDDIRETLSRVLAPQYAFCRKRFSGAVPAAWKG